MKSGPRSSRVPVSAPSKNPPLFCRLGLHRFGTWWPNIAPRSGGGPHYVYETCKRCGFEKMTRNRLA